MRYYIDEQMDYGNDQKIIDYILDLKDFTRDSLFDEFLIQRKKNYPGDYYTYDWIKGWKENYSKENNIDLIARAVEEKFYIFCDEEEHKINKQFVDNIINGLPVYNRVTNEAYNVK